MIQQDTFNEHFQHKFLREMTKNNPKNNMNDTLVNGYEIA